MKDILRAGGETLPAPVSLSVNNELIWTSDTGRLMDGTMQGEVIAEKKTVSIRWEFLNEEELVKIKKNLVAGFFPFTFHDDGIDMQITSYRGTLSKEHLGRLSDGIYYYRNVSVDIVER